MLSENVSFTGTIATLIVVALGAFIGFDPTIVYGYLAPLYLKEELNTGTFGPDVTGLGVGVGEKLGLGDGEGEAASATTFVAT
ncbi:MAG: hypothetical protein JO092_01695, partial [Candidatus Eremiobacteraeota bacterium]|nr:hypothetical protein [Candidatus Eremiobacteraeota bacterium]